MKTVIVTEDIFMKAAREYCRRIGKNPDGTEKMEWFTNSSRFRDGMEDLAERINSLKAVGAI